MKPEEKILLSEIFQILFEIVSLFFVGFLYL